MPKKKTKAIPMNAIKAYTPQLILGQKAEMKEIVSFLCSRNPWMTKGQIINFLIELHETILHFNRAGRGVKFDWLGTFTPKIGLDGVLNISYRLDSEFKKELNAPRTFSGKIKNKKMIGKTSRDLIARWNKEHPDDPIE